MLSVKEAAAELNCSISFVYKLLRHGELAFERRGRRKMPISSSIQEYRLRNLVQSQLPPISTSLPSTAGRYSHLFQKSPK
ncbi:MAG: helix-turn-helix domain-containing protein [Pirellulaceae bacterium]